MTVFLYDVPATVVGLPYKYIASDVSGDVIMNWTFKFDDPPETVNTQYLLRVFVPSLVNLEDTPFLTDYLTFNNITSHEYGTFGVNGFGLVLLGALQNYVNDSLARGIPNTPGINDFYPLNSEGVSLQFGGLFDIGRNWNVSHKRHRQGVDIDIGMSKLKRHTHTNDLMNILDERLRNAGFIFDVDAESIRATSAQVRKDEFHWHVRNSFGEIVKSGVIQND